jgi:hypothetical protein
METSKRLIAEMGLVEPIGIELGCMFQSEAVGNCPTKAPCPIEAPCM